MWSVVDGNVVMRRMTVLRTGECRDSGWVSLNIGHDLSASFPLTIHRHFIEFTM
jgi:hypothetical protein